MAFSDLREYIKTLEKTGDVLKIQAEVDWDGEAGAVNRRLYETNGPAVLFENIKDYQGGGRLFAGSLGTYRRVAIAFGLSPDASIQECYRAYEEGMKNPIPPVVVETGSCKEEVYVGDAVDLNELPAPMVHEGDGGRYIGTWDLVVTRDPESDWMNWGMYRFMIHDKNTLGGFPLPTSHLGTVLREKFVPKNKPMPVAICIGCEPLSHMAALSTFKWGITEAHMAGGLRREAVKLVKCETSELMVPASAEVVIEGEILPDGTTPEGPFGEYSGYRTGKVTGGVMMRVKAITHRRRPILSTISLGMPLDDNAVTVSMSAALTIKERLLRKKLPVKEVYVHAPGCVFLLVVQVSRGGRRVTKQILDCLTERRVFMSKILVVDEDVDPFNMDAVLHAFATKCHPGRGILVNEYTSGGNPIFPAYDEFERNNLWGATVAFDCTWPAEWDPARDIPVKASFADTYSPGMQAKVLERWKEYLSK